VLQNAIQRDRCKDCDGQILIETSVSVVQIISFLGCMHKFYPEALYKRDTVYTLGTWLGHFRHRGRTYTYRMFWIERVILREKVL